MEKNTENKLFLLFGSFALVGVVTGTIFLANAAAQWDEDAKAQGAYDVCVNSCEQFNIPDSGVDAGIHDYSINVISGDLTCQCNTAFGIIEGRGVIRNDAVRGIMVNDKKVYD